MRNEISNTYVTPTGMLVQITGAKKNILAAQKGQEETFTTVVENKDEESTYLWADWGSDNLFPQNKIKQAKTTIIPSAIELLTNIAYAKGPVPHILEGYDQDGYEILKPVFDLEIHSLLSRNSGKNFFWEIIWDLYYHGMCPVEMVKSLSGDKFVKFKRLQAAKTRLAKKSEKLKISENIFYSSNWPTPTEDQYATIPLLDPYDAYDDIDFVRNSKSDRFAYLVSMPLNDRDYYSETKWDGLLVSNGWISYVNKVPVFKNAFLDNQISIKYHITIPIDYFKLKFNVDLESDDVPTEKREELFREVQNEVDNYLTGVSAAGKTTFSYVGRGPDGKLLPGIEIKVIDGKSIDGEYLKDTFAGNIEMLSRLLLDPTIIGMGMLGGPYGGGASGGSNKREAFLIASLLAQPIREKAMEPIEFICKYNGITDKYLKNNQILVFRWPITQLTTLDKGAGFQEIKN